MSVVRCQRNPQIVQIWQIKEKKEAMNERPPGFGFFATDHGQLTMPPFFLICQICVICGFLWTTDHGQLTKPHFLNLRNLCNLWIPFFVRFF